MKWFDQWLYRKVRDMWDNSYQYENQSKERRSYKEDMLIGASKMLADSPRAEGQDRITFELTTAVGGRILNVRHYDDRKDRHETQTYVIPSGEDVGQRVAKILNLELLK